jgi:N-acetylneuraminate lyase
LCVSDPEYSAIEANVVQRFEGIWPALVTPMGSDGRPSLDVAAQLVEALIAEGLDGLYITGSTGQWPLLTLDERRAIAECVVQTVAGRIPVMVHVGAIATEHAVTLAQHAARIGADAVSTVSPVYYAHAPDAVFAHYHSIGSATDLPLFVYHLEMVNRLSLGAKEYTQRLLDVPNIAGMKITDVDMYLFGVIHSHAGDRLQLFSGADEVVCHAVLSGSIGAIGTFYNLWGPAVRRAWQAMRSGETERAKAFMLRFQRAISDVLSSGATWTFLRAAVQQKYGLDIGRPRPPLGVDQRPWDDAQVRELIALVEQAI